MRSRYTSPPIELPSAEEPFARADLIFYGLDHSSHSYEGRVFLNTPDADEQASREYDGYAGSFWIFGHGGCFGDVGHCDLPNREDPFDFRPAHQLEPAFRVLTVTGAIEQLIQDGAREVTVTVVAHVGEGRANEVLAFDTVRLATYA